MSATDSPPRDVKFIPETPTSVHSSESPQEHHHSSKKPRNYKYWSDEEVKKILHWLTLPENEGKLARNKAQACREVAKNLFDGDEYMAISVRSKLMSLEKGFREAEQLRSQLHTTDESLIHEIDKMKEISKFYKECKQLFGTRNNEAGFLPPISTSPNLQHMPTPSSYSSNSSHRHQSSPTHHLPPSTILPRPDYESDNNLPHLNEDRLRALSIPPHLMRRGSWTLPRVGGVDLAPVVQNEEEEELFRKKEWSHVKVARYAAKQASYAAKKAEYEALRSKHEQHKMECAIQLAKIELDRDALSVRKLELELELSKRKE
ncbi:uncharacterized protein B0P05DRAFT_466263 [Gilbertella persicaria]|uniref:uncharacterized protein n=1 Tax=Gilbertella persicaria TaxID=101096 RepID=UPI00222084BD|nr:uncharacterized protein B0P05DRAFT_466263 [Gilbertella persicaria]KAI8085858.1 hypothetical protein B0P05DRAFT_466263 [Gilbertella persicaria]